MSNNVRAARDQANAYESLFADKVLEFDDGSKMTIPPHPSLRLLDDEALERYEAYLAEVETYDRDENGDIKGPPFFKDGKLVTPPREIRIVKEVLGEEVYAELRSKKINGRPVSARDVWRLWNEQGAAVVAREAEDPKSDGGSGVLEDAS